MRQTRLLGTTLLIGTLAACSASLQGRPTETTRVEAPLESTATAAGVTTTTQETSTTAASTTTSSKSVGQPTEGEYTKSGKRFQLYRPTRPTHIVVLLHGLNTPLSAMQPLAQQFLADGSIVLVPAFDLALSLENRVAEAQQVACAVAYASSLDLELPLVLVGFSGGGYHAGLYVASKAQHWERSLCVVDTPARPLNGFILLDGPVDDPGWREAVGLPPSESPDAYLWDPVSIATPNSEISGAYFISGDLPAYARSAMEKFNAALGINGPITQLDTTHGGLIQGTFPEIPAAVLDVSGVGATSQ